MAGWREKKRTMLADVHQHFEIPAVYLTHATGTPIAVTVRVHRKQIVERPPLGIQDEVTAMHSIHDRIIFKKCQLPDVPEGVLSRSYVILGPDEVFITGPSKPERETYIWVEVSEATRGDIEALMEGINLADPAWMGVLR